MNLTFRLALSSDYLVASGQGLGGDIDSALFRDADGVPAIRGTVIEGLMRDELRRLLALSVLAPHRRCRASWPDAEDAAALESYCQGEEVCPLCGIVGSPGLPKSWVFSSLRPESLSDPISAPWSPGRSASQTVSRVRVSPRLRRAEGRKLFREEDGDSRLTFVFTTTYVGETRHPLPDAAMMVAAARMIRRFGLSRRRGRGACDVTLIAADPKPDGCEAGGEQAALLEVFERHWIGGEPLADERPAIAWQPVAARPDSGPVRFRVIVRTDEPVLVSRRGEAGNQLESNHVIPGGTVIGGLAARVASQWRLGQTDTRGDLYRTFVGVFRRGGMTCSPLVPAAVQNNRLSPAIVAPRDLFTCKRFPGFRFADTDAGHGVWALASTGTPPSECPVCAESRHTVPLEPIGDFVTIGGIRRSFAPRLSPEMHIRLDPCTGRVKEGDFFGYVVLDAGRHFIGELCFRDETAMAAARALTGALKENAVTTIRLGRARGRGHGLSALWCEKTPIDAPAADRPKAIDARVIDPSKWLVMTLLSPAILVDVWGRHCLTLDPHWLESVVLPQGVRLAREADGRPVVRPFCASEVIDGFNLHLGLPRWRDIAVVAGSSVGMKLAAPVDLSALRTHLKRIEQEGIGMRRAEGFGRVAFNHSAYDLLTKIAGDTIPCPEQLRLSRAGSEHPVQRRAIARELWLDHLDHLAGRDTSLFRDVRWTGVARWLRNRAPQGAAAIVADLEGHQGHSRLGNAGFAGQGLPPGRGRKDFFDPVGLQELKTLVKSVRNADETALTDLTAEQRIEMLADWIGNLSAAARKER